MPAAFLSSTRAAGISILEYSGFFFLGQMYSRFGGFGACLSLTGREISLVEIAGPTHLLFLKSLWGPLLIVSLNSVSHEQKERAYACMTTPDIRRPPKCGRGPPQDTYKGIFVLTTSCIRRLNRTCAYYGRGMRDELKTALT